MEEQEEREIEVRPDVEMQISDMVSENGMALEVPINLKFSKADAILSILWKTKDLSQFYIGDLLRQVENQEYYSQLLDETRYAKKTVDKFKRVAENVRPDGRWGNLSFDHHDSVNALEPNDQDEWLKYASEGGWTTAKLREELREAGLIKSQKKPGKPKVITCPHCDKPIVEIEDEGCPWCQLMVVRNNLSAVVRKKIQQTLKDIRYGEQMPPLPDWVIEICDRALEV